MALDVSVSTKNEMSESTETEARKSFSTRSKKREPVAWLSGSGTRKMCIFVDKLLSKLTKDSIFNSKKQEYRRFWLS